MINELLSKIKDILPMSSLEKTRKQANAGCVKKQR